MKANPRKLLPVALMALSVSTAHAALVQFVDDDDTTETVVLVVDGQAVNGNTTINGNTISNFSGSQSYGNGEMMSFRWTNPNATGTPGTTPTAGTSDGSTIGQTTYTRLKAFEGVIQQTNATTGATENISLKISDEFYITYLGAGAYDVTFVSSDSSDLANDPTYKPYFPIPDPAGNYALSALTTKEKPRFQDVAYTVDGQGTVLDTFQVKSVPTPGSLALLGIGLAGLHAMRRKA